MYQYAQTNSQAQSRKPHNGIKQQELCEKILFFQVYLVQDKGMWLNCVFTVFLMIFCGLFKISLNGKNWIHCIKFSQCF